MSTLNYLISYEMVSVYVYDEHGANEYLYKCKGV